MNKNVLNLNVINHLIYQILSILILVILLQRINIGLFELIGFICISVCLSYFDYITWGDYNVSLFMLLILVFIVIFTYTKRKEAMQIINKITIILN